MRKQARTPLAVVPRKKKKNENLPCHLVILAIGQLLPIHNGQHAIFVFEDFLKKKQHEFSALINHNSFWTPH